MPAHVGSRRRGVDGKPRRGTAVLPKRHVGRSAWNLRIPANSRPVNRLRCFAKNPSTTGSDFATVPSGQRERVAACTESVGCCWALRAFCGSPWSCRTPPPPRLPAWFPTGAAPATVGKGCPIWPPFQKTTTPAFIPWSSPPPNGSSPCSRLPRGARGPTSETRKAGKTETDGKALRRSASCGASWTRRQASHWLDEVYRIGRLGRAAASRCSACVARGLLAESSRLLRALGRPCRQSVGNRGPTPRDSARSCPATEPDPFESLGSRMNSRRASNCAVRWVLGHDSWPGTWIHPES